MNHWHNQYLVIFSVSLYSVVVIRRKIIGCKCCVGSTCCDPTTESEDENQQTISTENEIEISPADIMAKKEPGFLGASICE